MSSNMINIRTTIAFFFILIQSILILATARGDENSWSTNGPYDARVMTIAIHPFDNQRIYLGTIENGIYETTDGGQYWEHIDSDSLEPNMRVIAIHPAAPDTMFAATVRGVFRSNDAGESWNKVQLAFAPNNEVRTLVICPYNPSVILTGSLSYIQKSTDGGASWNLIYVNNSIQEIEYDPQNRNRVYYVSESADWRKSIFRSDDLGDSWVNIHNDLDSVGMVQDMAIDPVDPQIIYLAQHVPFDSADRCLSKTTDGGQHWFDITPPGLYRKSLYNVTVLPSDNNMVFVCSWGNAVLRSTDGGDTWEPATVGLRGKFAEIIVVDAISGVIYLGMLFDGIYRSTNNGDSWEKISYNIPQASCGPLALNCRSPDSIYVISGNGVYFSEDGAQTWGFSSIDPPISFGNVTAIALDLVDPNHIFAGYFSNWLGEPGGMAHSTDGGSSWSYSNSGLPFEIIPYAIGISRIENSPTRLFIATNRGVYQSDDLGDSWSLVQGGLPGQFYCPTLTVCPSDNNIILAATGDLTLYKTTDRGLHWNGINIATNHHATEIVWDPVDPDIVYATFNIGDGIYKSTNGGQDWFDITNNIPGGDFFLVSGVAVNPLNPVNIFVFSHGQGVFISHDAGGSWNDFSSGLDPGFGYAYIQIDPTDTCRLFMSTSSHSVWSFTRTPTGIVFDESILPRDITIQNYPNPFNSTTTIEFALPEAGEVSLTIYDILGRKISQPLSDFLTAGNHKINIDMSEFPSGLYFYVLNADKTTISKKMIYLK
jgi:photosystem II stability/assembly factor-like uncharacterized protein